MKPCKVNGMEKDGLVSFLYILLRDHLPAGEIERIIVEHVDKAKKNGPIIYDNAYLASYAAELADRIQR